MRRFVNRMIRGMGPICALLLVLSFAAPAFASHVCADSEACAQTELTVVQAASDADPACPDCGPACANGCCHAPHAATPPAIVAPDVPRAIARAEAWLEATASPPVRLAGPDRPPRT